MNLEIRSTVEHGPSTLQGLNELYPSWVVIVNLILVESCSYILEILVNPLNLDGSIRRRKEEKHIIQLLEKQ